MAVSQPHNVAHDGARRNRAAVVETLLEPLVRVGEELCEEVMEHWLEVVAHELRSNRVSVRGRPENSRTKGHLIGTQFGVLFAYSLHAILRVAVRHVMRAEARVCSLVAAPNLNWLTSARTCVPSLGTARTKYVPSAMQFSTHSMTPAAGDNGTTV